MHFRLDDINPHDDNSFTWNWKKMNEKNDPCIDVFEWARSESSSALPAPVWFEQGPYDIRTELGTIWKRG